MKRMKHVLAMIVCMIMAIGMSMNAFAATYTLTINNTTDGHTYQAYQIFSGTLAEKDGKQILSNIEWGSSVPNPSDLLADIQAESGLSVLHAATDAASLAVLLQGVTSDSETLDLFAEVVGENLGAVAGESTDAGNYYTILGLNAGYYLVKDKDDSLDGAEDVYTKYIIRVLKDEEVTPKGDVPKVDKTINDTIDGTFTNIEDFDINDTAYYKLVGTLPSNLKSYATYYYKFTDTLPTGIEFLQIEQIYIEGHDGNLVHTFYDVTDTDTSNDILPAEITSVVAGKVVTVEFNNLLSLYSSILPTQKIVVKYTARVTRDALIAEPMTNKVKVDFSNNPNGDGIGDVGETPKDVAHAFTFQINVDKYDADNKNEKLEGAEFVLYYERVESDVVVKYYAMVITEEMITAGIKINGVQVDADDLGIVYGWTSNVNDASVLDTDVNGALSVKGLDEGIYYLKETTPPTGYNLMETPVQIKIIPTYTEAGDAASVTVSYEVDSIAQATNTVGVRNSAGSTLPVTGGIGTTMFYVFGGIMVLGAAVLLITKKRMGTEE